MHEKRWKSRWKQKNNIYSLLFLFSFFFIISNELYQICNTFAVKLTEPKLKRCRVATKTASFTGTSFFSQSFDHKIIQRKVEVCSFIKWNGKNPVFPSNFKWVAMQVIAILLLKNRRNDEGKWWVFSSFVVSDSDDLKRIWYAV